MNLGHSKRVSKVDSYSGLVYTEKYLKINLANSL